MYLYIYDSTLRIVYFFKNTILFNGASPVALVIKKKILPASAGDIRDEGSMPESGRSPGRRHGYPLQYSYLENPTDRGPGGLYSIGCKELNVTEVTEHETKEYIYLKA